MNKNELCAEIARRTTISRKDPEQAIEAMAEIICDQLRDDEKVQIVNFGAFEAKHRPARRARNPKTGESIQIGQRRTVVFKPGKGLKASVED